jgi:hypothetical protein
MDRPVSGSVATPPGLDEASASGWDAHAVWQERVRDAQLGASSSRATPRIVLAERSAGWDPLETWRLRVQRPRRKPA